MYACTPDCQGPSLGRERFSAEVGLPSPLPRSRGRSRGVVMFLLSWNRWCRDPSPIVRTGPEILPCIVLFQVLY